MRALSTAATGMAAQQLNVEVISNNIANMNTVGFKRQRAEFEDLLYQDMERAGSQTSGTGTVAPTGIQIGAGVKAGSVYRITEQGSMTQTGNKLDLAIKGRGFFQVLMPSGETAYTRAGNLSVNQDGQLVTSDGYPDPAPGHHSAERDGRHHFAHRPGASDPVRLDRAHRGRSAAARQLHQRGGAGGAGRQPVHGERGVGRGGDR